MFLSFNKFCMFALRMQRQIIISSLCLSRRASHNTPQILKKRSIKADDALIFNKIIAVLNKIGIADQFSSQNSLVFCFTKALFCLFASHNAINSFILFEYFYLSESFCSLHFKWMTQFKFCYKSKFLFVAKISLLFFF